MYERLTILLVATWCVIKTLGIIRHVNQTPQKAINAQPVSIEWCYDNLKTGDLVLTTSVTRNVTAVLPVISDAYWTHLGIIVEYHGCLYVWDSVCAIQQHKNTRFTPLKLYVNRRQKAKVHVGIRQLSGPPVDARAMFKFIKDHWYTPFALDASLVALNRLFYNFAQIPQYKRNKTNPHENPMYCAEMSQNAYIALGVIRPNPKLPLPRDFCPESFTIPMMPGYSFGDILWAVD